MEPKSSPFFEFRLRKNAKAPYFGYKWKEGASQTKIKRDGLTNYAIATGRPHPAGGFLFVFDNDNHDSWQQVKQNLSIPETYKVTTPRGGEHYYVRTSRALSNSTSKLAYGVDTRGKGGFVVAPGSFIDEKEYVLHNSAPDGQVPMLPLETEEAIAKILGDTQTEIPTMAVSNQFKAYIDSIDTIPQGQRNHGLFKLSARLGDLGAHGRELWMALNYANQARVSPPIASSELKAIFNSSQKNRQNPVGVDQIQGTVDVSELIEKLNGNSESEKIECDSPRKALPLPTLPPLGEKIKKAIMSNSVRQNEELAIGATIALASAAAVSARCYINIFGRYVYPNMFHLLLSPTGGGKDSPMKFVQNIGLKMGFCESGDVTSGAGLYDLFLKYKTVGEGKDKTEEATVKEDSLRKLLIKDECSGLIKTINNGNSTGENLSNLLCDLITSGRNCIAPRHYSQREKKVERPWLPFSKVSLLWATTPSSFSDASCRNNIGSGLIGRAVIVNSNLRPSANLIWKNRKVISSKEIEKDIDRIRAIIRSRIENRDLSPPENKIDEYEAKIQEISDYLDKAYIGSEEVAPRLCINVEKVAIAMAFLESEKAPQVVTVRHLEMAQSYIEWACQGSLEVFENFNLNEQDKLIDAMENILMNRLVELGKNKGHVSLSRLTHRPGKKLSRLNEHKIMGLLENLRKQGKISLEEVSGGVKIGLTS